MMSVLNNYAPFISAISTAISATATVVIAIYAIINAKSLKISREMLNFEKEKEIKEKEPHLVFYQEPLRDAHGVPAESSGRVVYVKNVGLGPALNIVVQHKDALNHKNPVGLSIDPLGSMERTMSYMHYRHRPVFEEESYSAIVEYEDIFGNLFRTEIKGGVPPKQKFCKIGQKSIPTISPL